VRAVEDGLSLRAAAAAFNVSPATAHRWWHRWLEGSEDVELQAGGSSAIGDQQLQDTGSTLLASLP
jgi:transposase